MRGSEDKTGYPLGWAPVELAPLPEGEALADDMEPWASRTSYRPQTVPGFQAA